jgi:hypothetical protein
LDALFPLKEKVQNDEKNPQVDRDIRQIEHRKYLEIDVIYDVTVKYPVEQVAQASAEYYRKSHFQEKILLFGLRIKIYDDGANRDAYQDQEQPFAGKKPECDTCVPDRSQIEDALYQRYRSRGIKMA